jgi:peptidoglycan/xylan/chitin deacetylase (PgdA/CDA1 family)
MIIKNQLYKIVGRFYPKGIHNIFFLNKMHCVILAYHKVSPLWENCLFPDMVVEPAMFESQIKYLKENYEIIPLSSLENFFKNGRNKKARAAVITFDDGYEDNYTYALPILKQYQIPATIFISTAFIETRKAFWGDILDLISRKAKQLPVSFKYNDNGYTLKMEGKYKFKTFKQIANILKFTDKSEQEAILNLIAGFLQVKIQDVHSLFLSWKQMNEMQNNNIYFGAHAHYHQRLSGLDEKTLREELQRPKELLENRLNQKIDDFAYPYGEAGDFNKKTINLLIAAGYKRGLTMLQGHVFNTRNPFILKRIGIGGYDTTDIFKLKLNGVIPLFK